MAHVEHKVNPDYYTLEDGTPGWKVLRYFPAFYSFAGKYWIRAGRKKGETKWQALEKMNKCMELQIEANKEVIAYEKRKEQTNETKRKYNTEEAGGVCEPT